MPPDAWINTAVAVADLAAGRRPQADHSLDFDGQDFRTALNLVAAGLGVALLPALVLVDQPASVVVRPLRGRRLVRRLFTCRLDTRGVTEPVRRLEAYLRDAAAF